MRVVTFNVQSCRAGIDLVASVLREADPDVVMLNEVARGQERALAKALHRVAVKGVTMPLRGYGNAILLREKPTAILRFRLSKTSGREQRGIVIARLASGLTAVVTHFGLSADERRRHVAELLHALDGVQPVVIGADLNEPPNGPSVRFLTARFVDAFAVAGQGTGATIPVHRPERRIDYVLVSRGIAVRQAAVMPRVASDHLAVSVEIDL